MIRNRIAGGSPFEDRLGYSRAVVQGDWCFVAGTTGADPESGDFPASARVQARNALDRIAKALTEAGFAMQDVVRATYILSDRSHIDDVAPELRATFGAIRPAATMIVAGLIDPAMKIEIEVTAFQG
ncbi:enamine deaminase RidA (YjgF/YER057c/UK114 family) [Albidovulum inexpectatum]|uniref:Enamine deaminase RidA (YjgF/YER057c/UK114 family) n=1 Tax=Albidovulum inexpectatum TaxID=196587 RepID=A0A2S5JMM5_9RHOB|nr:RidA family protein [Albidovulum inexpectatum]PPB82651.1 enamine deaminase RidA (YjgF/YER057c/UK114 family) [Albidovulum inexpectatum]